MARQARPSPTLTEGKKGGVKKPKMGRPPFVASKEQKRFVRLMIADGVAHERIILAIINPQTSQPISIETFIKVFAAEIAIGKIEIQAVMTTSLVDQAKKGSLGHIVWWEKTRLGYHEPFDPKGLADKTDPAGSEVHHEIEVVGGLPQGSTPENPAGDVKPDGSVETDTVETIVGDDETNA
jgi:hypothetical protein